MDREHLIPAQVFCTHHEVEISFITTLQDFGLIHITRINDEDFIDETELQKLEKLSRLHYELDVNAEGVDVINHMLTRMEQMQAEIDSLRERLRFYEEG